MAVTTAPKGGRTPAAIGEGERSPAIYGIRGLCALGLVIIHAAWLGELIGTEGEPPSNYAGAFLVGGFQILVGVFFLLTGLFLYRPFARAIIAGTRRPDLGRYFLRRVLRLLPAFYAMYLVVLLALNAQAIDGVWYVLRPIFLLHIYDFTWMNGMEVTWAVPSEFQWYLALPVIAWATHKFAARGATPAVRAYRLMLPLLALVVIGFGWFYLVHSEGLGLVGVFWWPIGLAANVAIGMALGIMLALFEVSPKDNPKLFRLAADHPNLFLLGAVVVVLVNSARPLGEIGTDDYPTVSGALVFYLLFILFSLLAVLPLVAPGGGSRLIETTLANRPVVYLGRISYGVYLWHYAVMHFYLQNVNFFGNTPETILELRGMAGFWELEIVTIAGAIAIASVSYFLLERPLMSWGERYLRRRKRRLAAAPDQPRPEAVPS